MWKARISVKQSTEDTAQGGNEYSSFLNTYFQINAMFLGSDKQRIQTSFIHPAGNQSTIHF